MSDLDPAKLHVTFSEGTPKRELSLPRRYTLTHSDFTGELFLTIGREYDRKQIGGLYTRLMRDEVLAELKPDEDRLAMQVYCHVSGGLVLGSARWRNDILVRHMPMVIAAFIYGDRELILRHAGLQTARVLVHFRSNHPAFNRVEDRGTLTRAASLNRTRVI
jgi:hypothetical protein